MIRAYVLSGSVASLLLIIIVGVLVVSKLRYAQRRKTLEQALERYLQSGLALLRYVMLNRRCSEDAAYERIATFVKNHVPLDDQSYADQMLAQDRQSLLDMARQILAQDPDAIDKI